MNVLVYDKYRRDIQEKEDDVTIVDIDELLSQSDIVSIHLPLTDETHMMVNQAFFNRMKKGSIMINTSRGKILDSEALLQALSSGHISGACLDVLENEKPETWTEEQTKIYKGLLDRSDVIITPHIAGWTHLSLELIASILLEKICKYYEV